MHTAGPHKTDDEAIGPPKARLYAQDESYVLPLREYLQSHGVDVVVNRPANTPSSYYIAAGDATYVKQIFSRLPDRGAKRMGIILGGGQRKEEFSGNIKFIFADPVPLTPSDVLEVFTLLFTEGKNRLDIRRNPQTRIVHEPAAHESDRARVQAIIADVYKPKKHPRKKSLRAWLLGILMGIGIIVIPTAWYGISTTIGGVAIYLGARALRSGNFSSVSWDTRVADYWIHQGTFVLNTVSIPFSWIGWQDAVRGQQRLISFMKDTSRAETEGQALTSIAARVATGLLNQVDAQGTGAAAASDISQLRVSLYALGTTLGLAQAELSVLLADRTFPFSIRAVSKKGEEATADLVAIRQSTGDMDKLLSLFLSLAGFREPRTYLILLQNSMELRPSGGFIGSVAVVSFADGRLTNVDIQDVYTFDGQLKGHVDPPLPIRELLGEEHWYLRDSNWDPDFLTAGKQAAWFYQKETGTQVDGVFAVSTPFVTKLLQSTGPIELSDYNDRITAENFYGKSLYYTQNDFFPGSTQKKDFLGALARALIARLTSGKDVNTATLFRAITASLAAHDILFQFNDENLQSLAQRYGWAGKVPAQAGCEGVEKAFCTFDPLVAVEANLGVNKVNSFISRTARRDITIQQDGTRLESVTMTIRNASSGASGMSYRAYLRVLLPPAASVGEVTVEGVTLPIRSGSKAPHLPYTESTKDAAGQTGVGIALDSPAGSELHLVVAYTVHAPLLFGPSGTVLDAYTSKQPGVSDTPLVTTIRYPGAWTAGIEEGGAAGDHVDFIANTGQLQYNTILTRDNLTRIRFTKP